MPTVWKIILNNFTAIWKAVEYKYLCSTVHYPFLLLCSCVFRSPYSLSAYGPEATCQDPDEGFSLFSPNVRLHILPFPPSGWKTRTNYSSSLPLSLPLDPRPRQKPKAVSDSGIWVCLQNNFSFIPSLSFRLPSFRTLGIARN